MPTAVRESRYQTHEHPLQDRREKNLDLVRLVRRKENTDAAQGTDYSPISKTTMTFISPHLLRQFCNQEQELTQFLCYSAPHDVNGKNAALMACKQIIDEIADDGVWFVA